METKEILFCSRCENNSTHIKITQTFGKLVCVDCLKKRKKSGIKGNSGMVYYEDTHPSQYCMDLLFDVGDKLFIEQVKKSHPLYVKWFIEHYPKSKGIVGRQFNFLIYKKKEPIGIIGFASPPLNYIKFNNYFGFTDGNHSENAKYFLNNNAFRLINNEPNLGTQILKLCREQLFNQYHKEYGIILKGLVTFVEPPRSGAMYKADNWDLIGETEGVEVKRRGENWTEKSYQQGNKKLIFGYKYNKKKRIMK
jgi:hypothetical protein